MPLLVVCGAYGDWGADFPKEAEIKHLPGFQGNLPSKMFSGYVNIPASQKRLFYVLVTSQHEPKRDPLIFWWEFPSQRSHYNILLTAGHLLGLKRSIHVAKLESWEGLLDNGREYSTGDHTMQHTWGNLTNISHWPAGQMAVLVRSLLYSLACADQQDLK